MASQNVPAKRECCAHVVLGAEACPIPGSSAHGRAGAASGHKGVGKGAEDLG
jgi:hypothetical protein